MEKSHLPLPQRKKIPVLSKEALLVNNNNNNSSDKMKTNRNQSKSKTTSISNDMFKAEPSSPCKNKSKDNLAIYSSKKNLNFSAKNSQNAISSSSTDFLNTNSNVENKHMKSRVGEVAQTNSVGFHQLQNQHGAHNLNKNNKLSFSDLQNSRSTSLKSFSKHLPQFAKDVLTSKGCTSKVQPTYQKLDKFKFENDLVAEEIEHTDDFDDNEGSPIYHELDPIGIQCSKHTYQSIGEIQEELNKLGSMFDMSEPHSAPPIQINNSPEPLLPCQTICSTPVTPAKTKSAPKQSFFSKMWQPKKIQKPSSKDCKFLTSMPLLLPKNSSECLPENQHSPSLVTFLGINSRNQMGSLSQPGSANLEKSNFPSSSSSPHSHRVFTFEDIEIDNDQFINTKDLSSLDRATHPPNSVQNDKKSHFKGSKSSKVSQNIKVSPLVINSNKTSPHPNNKCYATLMFPENHLPNKTCSRKRNKSSDKSVGFAVNNEGNLQSSFNQIYSTLDSDSTHRRNRINCFRYSSDNHFNHDDLAFDQKIYPSIYSSVESVLSQDTLRSDSPILPYSSSSLHRSPFSSPSCGIRMLEIRANSRKSDSKSPSPELQPQQHHHGFIQTKDAFVSNQPHVIKSPPRVICKSPNKYMHTIMEEDHGIDQSIYIERFNGDGFIEEDHLDENENQAMKSNDSRINYKITLGSSEVQSSRSVSLSSDLFSSEDSVSCHTTDSELSGTRNDNDSVFVKTIDPHERIFHMQHQQCLHQQEIYEHSQMPQNWVNDGISYKILNQKLHLKNPSSSQIQEVVLESPQLSQQSHQQQQIKSLNKTSKLPQYSKLQSPKFLTSIQQKPISNNLSINPADTTITDDTFQTASNVSPNIHGPNKQVNSGLINLQEQTAMINSKKSSLPGPSMGVKHTSALKYSNQMGKISQRKISSSQEPVSPSQKIQPPSDLVAIEIKPHHATLVSPTKMTKPLSKSLKTSFGFVRDLPSSNHSQSNGNKNDNKNNLSPGHCQTIPVPSRTLPSSLASSGNFASFPKSKTVVINSFHSKGSSSNSSGICEHNGSLSSSPTSSNSSMFSTLDSENDGLLFSLRKDLSFCEGRFRIGDKIGVSAKGNKTISVTNENSSNINTDGGGNTNTVFDNENLSNNLEKFNNKTTIPGKARTNNVLKSPTSKVAGTGKDSLNSDLVVKPSKLQSPRVNDVKSRERFNKILHGTFEPHISSRSKSPKVAISNNASSCNETSSNSSNKTVVASPNSNNINKTTTASNNPSIYMPPNSRNSVICSVESPFNAESRSSTSSSKNSATLTTTSSPLAITSSSSLHIASTVDNIDNHND